MADLSKTIAIIFSGVDELSGPINTISKKLDSFSHNITAIGAPLDAAAMGILKVDAALVTMAGGGLLYAFNQSTKYEQAVIELQKVMKGSGGITEELEEKFKSLSREYGISTTSIILSTAGLAQSGYDTAEGLKVLDTSLKLTRASELDLDEATNLLKRTLIGYKLSVDDSIKVGDLWNHSSQVTNTNVTKLAEAFAIVSRQAADSGFSMVQAAAALSPIIGVFDSGEEAGIAFSTMLARMLDPTKKGEAAIRELTGVTGPLNEEFATGKDLFEAVARGLQGVDSQTGLVAVAQIVGVQQAKRIKVAFDDYYKTLDAIGPAADRYNSLQKEVDLQNASATASVDKLKISFGELAIAIGNEFREAAQEAIDGGTSIERALEDIVKSDTFDPIFAALREFGGDVGAFLEQIADDLPEALAGVDFSGLLNALGGVGEALGDLFNDVDLSTPEGLQDAIQDVIDTLKSLANTSTGIFESLAIISNAILSLTRTFNDLNPDTKELVGNILGLGTVMVTLGGVVGVSGILLRGIGAFSGMLGSGSLLATGITGIIALLSGPAGLAIALGVASAAIIGFSTKSLNAEHEATMKAIDATSKATMALYEQITNLPSDVNTVEIYAAVDRGELDLAQSMIDEITKEGQESNIKAEVEDAEFVDYWGRLSDLPEEKSTEILALMNAGKMDEVQKAFEEIEEEKNTEVIPKVSPPAIAKVNKDLGEIHEFKMIEIQLQGDIDMALAEMEGDVNIALANIEASADMVQTAFEWTAKVDISKIEADAKVAAAAFDSVAESVSATAAASADMFGSFIENINDLSFVDKWQMLDILKQQMAMEQQTIDIQRALTEAQIEYMQAKSDALKQGDGLIKIESDGLEPALEMIMFQILEKVQLRVTEEAGEFLLGLGVTE